MNDPRELPEWLQREADIDRTDRGLKRLAIAVIALWLVTAIAVALSANDTFQSSKSEVEE